VKTIIGVVTLIALSAYAHASTVGNSIGVGYLAKSNGTKVYSNSTGDDVDGVYPADFPLIAFDSSTIFSGIMATESESDGRLHVRYYKNGKDSSGGENTAWIDIKYFKRVRFGCCGDNKCSGIKAQVFKSSTYSDCFVQAVEQTINNSKAADTGSDIEKLKLQLEIEKLKLEQQRMKQTATPQSQP
jgi:hypothetical protein